MTSVPSSLPPGAIDAHAHVFPRARPGAASARVAVEDEAPVERYLDLLDAHGMAGGVLVQPRFLGLDNSYLLAALARVPARLRGVVALDAATPDRLERLRLAGVAGIRLDLGGLGEGGKSPDFSSGQQREFLAAVARSSLHLEIRADGPLWPRILKPLLASGCRLVIEDFGLPSAGLGPRCPGFQALAAAARDADIWFKLSAPYRLSPPTAAWACADVLLKIPGVGRLVWGSSWPWPRHTHTTYEGAIAWLTEWVPEPAARAQIVGANARTLYGFNKPLNVAAPAWKRL